MSKKNIELQSIPFFNLSRQYEKYKQEIKEEINNILESQAFIGGKFVEEFEKNLSKFLNVENVISCNSGTDAIWMALKAIGLKKNEIVLTSKTKW